MKEIKEKTFLEEIAELTEAFREVIYQIAKSSRLLWLVNKTLFLDYKDWMKIRIDRDKIKVIK